MPVAIPGLGVPARKLHILEMRLFKSHAPKASRGQSEVPNPKTLGPKQSAEAAEGKSTKPKEIGGPSGPEPTRYGDWERNGICSDF